MRARPSAPATFAQSAAGKTLTRLLAFLRRSRADAAPALAENAAEGRPDADEARELRRRAFEVAIACAGGRLRT